MFLFNKNSIKSAKYIIIVTSILVGNGMSEPVEVHVPGMLH